MDDSLDEVWSEESSVETSDYVHINLHPDEPSHKLAIRQGSQPKILKTHTFPTKVPDWSNIKVLHRNTLPPRSSFFVYDTVEDALTRDVAKSKTLSLSGEWKFSLLKSPFDVEPDFFSPTFDTTAWGKIKVPGMWQLQGYGKGPQYAVHSFRSSTRVTVNSDIPMSTIHFLLIQERFHMTTTRPDVISQLSKFPRPLNPIN